MTRQDRTGQVWGNTDTDFSTRCQESLFMVASESKLLDMKYRRYHVEHRDCGCLDDEMAVRDNGGRVNATN